MTLRPKIVKLIDKYSQKRGAVQCLIRYVETFGADLFFIILTADLVSMNETFVKARTIFDRMMEESLARHTAGTGIGVSAPY